MKLKGALKEFRRYLNRSGVADVPRTPAEGVTRMLGFYADVRAVDVDLQADGDMLLFQWGTYDWGEGPMFEFDITRQLIGRDAEDDDDIWQLHLTYRFAPSDSLRSFGDGNRWCSHPNQLAEFRPFIAGSPATGAVGSRTDGDVRLEYECAG